MLIIFHGEISYVLHQRLYWNATLYLILSFEFRISSSWFNARSRLSWICNQWNFFSTYSSTRSYGKFCLALFRIKLIASCSSIYAFNAFFTSVYQGRLAKNFRGRNSDIVWSGSPWMCGKQLKHYPSFGRNGITIPVRTEQLLLRRLKHCIHNA